MPDGNTPTLLELVAILDRLDDIPVAYQVREGRLKLHQKMACSAKLKGQVETHSEDLATICADYTYTCAKCKGIIRSTMVTTAEGDVYWHSWCSGPLPLPVKNKVAQTDRTSEPISNRAQILKDLRRRGIEFRLTPNGMQFRDCNDVISVDEREGIHICRDGLAEQLRIEAGICTRCRHRNARTSCPDYPFTGSIWCKECEAEEGWCHYERLMSGTHPTHAKSTENTMDSGEEFDMQLDLELGSEEALNDEE